MKYKRPVNSGKLGRWSSKELRKYQKRRAHKLFRRASKNAIRDGKWYLAPKWGKYHGWED